MPRTARLLDSSGGIYHVITRGNNRADVFHDDDFRRAYLDILRDTRVMYRFAIFHFVLMDNHVHLDIAPKHGSDLALIMQRVNQLYSLYHKRRTSRVGHLWETRYKSEAITSEGHALKLGIYIECNPVRAGIIADPEKYRWSSHRHYALGERHPLITDDPMFETLGRNPAERQASYRALTRMWGLSPKPAKEGVPKTAKRDRHQFVLSRGRQIE